jgi:hypothetical protein
MLFSVGYTLHYDQSGVIYSLSQVQKFLCLGAAPKKKVTSLTTFLKQKQVLGASFFSTLETTKKRGGVKKALKGVYIA